MNLSLDGFAEAFGIGTIGAVTVRASLIPNSEREPLLALTPLMNEVRTISSDRLTLHFPDLDPWTVVSLEITP